MRRAAWRRSASPSTGPSMQPPRAAPIDFGRDRPRLRRGRGERAARAAGRAARAGVGAGGAGARWPAAARRRGLRRVPHRARRPLRAGAGRSGPRARTCRAVRSASGRCGTSRTSTRTGPPRARSPRATCGCCARRYRALKAADPGARGRPRGVRELLLARARRRLPRRRPPVVRRRRGAPVQRAAGERPEDRAAHPRGDGARRRPPQGPHHLRAHLAVRARADAQHDRLRDDRAAGQAVRLRNAYAALLRIRRSARIRQVFWYTWLSAGPRLAELVLVVGAAAPRAAGRRRAGRQARPGGVPPDRAARRGRARSADARRRAASAACGDSILSDPTARPRCRPERGRTPPHVGAERPRHARAARSATPSVVRRAAQPQD